MFHLFKWWRWWRKSISTLILICLNIECDNRLLSFLNARNFQLNIKFRSKDVLFMKLYIIACCNDICCLIYRLSRISFLHLRWSMMMMIKFDLLKNRWTRNVAARYESCCEFSLNLRNLIDKHLLKSLWLCMNRSFYDQAFWIICSSWCSWRYFLINKSFSFDMLYNETYSWIFSSFSSIRWSCFRCDDKTSAFFFEKTFKKSWYLAEIIDLRSMTFLLFCFLSWMFKSFMKTANIWTFFWRDNVLNEAATMK